MSPEITQGVLQDVVLILTLGLGLGLIVYQIIHAMTVTAWGAEGNVLSRPYGVPDAVVALLLAGFFGWSIIGMDTANPAPDVKPGEYALALFFGSMFLMLVALLIVVYMAAVRKMNPAEMFGLRSMKLTAALGYSVLWLVAVVVIMGVLVALIMEVFLQGQWIDASEQDVVDRFRKMDSIGMRALMAFAAVIIAPITEEIIFRGYFYGVTKRFTERWFATIITSLFFACIHGHVGSFLPLFLLAVGFAVAYEVTGCLWVPIFMHMIFNGGNVLRMWLS